MKTIILNQKNIQQKTERIAYEIYEHSFENDEIYIGGIAGNGYVFAERIHQKLIEISKSGSAANVHLFQIKINKVNPLLSAIEVDIEESKLKNATVVLVDDVVNSGKTLLHAVSKILNLSASTIKTAVLVNRTHRKFPISADFVGTHITTTLKDNITVDFGKDDSAYLE